MSDWACCHLTPLLKRKTKTSPRGRTDSHRVSSPLSLNEEANSLRKLGHGPGQMSNSLFLPGTKTKWEGRMGRVSRQHRGRLLETHLPKPASQRGWVRTITQEKGDTWEAGTPKILQMQRNKAIDCRTLGDRRGRCLTQHLLAVLKEGTWS